MTATWVPAVVIGAVLLPRPVPAAPRAGDSAERAPESEVRRVAPPKLTRAERRAIRRARDLSLGGTRKGGLEFGLAAVTTVIAGVLIGRGIWEVDQATKTEQLCASGESAALECGFDNPAATDRAAAGLSFAFGGLVAIGSALLYARGARILRDYRTFERTRRTPALSIAPPRAGALVHIRF